MPEARVLVYISNVNDHEQIAHGKSQAVRDEQRNEKMPSIHEVDHYRGIASGEGRDRNGGKWYRVQEWGIRTDVISGSKRYHLRRLVVYRVLRREA